MKNYKRESIVAYRPRTIEGAKELFEKFKQMELENLDKEKFFFLFDKGEGEVGFCIRNNTWQVCQLESSNLFNVTVVEM